MWETYELGNEDMLWAATTFNGGIGSQQQAPCGAISASAVCLGLRHRCSPDDRQRVKQARHEARQDAGELVRNFNERVGSIICRDLVGLDLSNPKALRQFQEPAIQEEKCNNYIRFVIEKLYELDERRSVAGQ